MRNTKRKPKVPFLSISDNLFSATSLMSKWVKTTHYIKEGLLQKIQKSREDHTKHENFNSKQNYLVQGVHWLKQNLIDLAHVLVQRCPYKFIQLLISARYEIFFASNLLYFDGYTPFLVEFYLHCTRGDSIVVGLKSRLNKRH